MVIDTSTSATGSPTATNARAKTVYDYDPAKAKALLAAAGVTNLTINLMAVNVSWIVDCLPTIANSWDAIGVKTTPASRRTPARCSPRWTSRRTTRWSRRASNPNQFGLDADLITALQLHVRRHLDEVHQVGHEPGRQGALRADGQGRRRSRTPRRSSTLMHAYMDVIAEQAVLYPVVHTELMTAWNPKKLTGVRAQAYPGVDLLQAKRV